MMEQSRTRRHLLVAATCILLAALPHAHAQEPSASAALTTPRPYLYVGEEIPLTLTLRTRSADVAGLELNGLPQSPHLKITSDFTPGPVQRRPMGNETEEVRTFTTSLLGRSPGNVPFNTTMNVTLLISRSRGFFTQQSTHTTRLTLPPLALQVRPLPPPPTGTPTTEAIGNFQIDISLSSTNVAVGDLIIVRSELRGDGNIAAISLPELSPGDHFRVYPPKTLKNTETHRIQEQILVPQSDTATTIAPLQFTWFDTIAERYQTRTFGPFTLAFHEQQTIDAGMFRPPNTTTQSTGAATHPVPDIDRTHASVASQTTARLAPSYDAAALFLIPAGAPVRQIRTYGEWQTVEYQERRGWIPLPDAPVETTTPDGATTH